MDKMFFSYQNGHRNHLKSQQFWIQLKKLNPQYIKLFFRNRIVLYLSKRIEIILRSFRLKYWTRWKDQGQGLGGEEEPADERPVGKEEPRINV